MEKGLSTERGSAGIDMILLSFMVLIFLAAPLLSGIFEVYCYVMHGVVWSAATENILDQVQWQMETEALSECERKLLLSATQGVFAKDFDALVEDPSKMNWTLKELTYVAGEPPRLEVRVGIKYKPVTMVGVFISRGGWLELELNRRREFPIDR